GGLNTCSRSLAALLVPLEGERLVSHLRIVDKYSVSPPTTYLGAEFPKILAQPDVEYRQVNLTVPSAVASAFDPPEGQAAYSYVFDLTGEIRYDRTEMIAIKMTFNVSRLVGLEAARRNVQAYVRLQLPVYESSEKSTHDEKEDVKPAKPLDVWWHETVRMLSAIEGLNLVVLRVGFVYGPYIDFGIYTSVITVASVYGYMKKPMKTLWSPGKDPMYTVHSDDVAGGLWACAQWIAPLGRKEADIIAGEQILFHNEKSKVSEVEGMPPCDAKLIAPLFNLVDDSEITLLKGGEIVTAYFGTTFEFHSFMINAYAKANVVEEINEHHVGVWTEMLSSSNPPITQTPLTAYMDTFTLSRHKLAYSNNKIKEVMGYKLKRPEFNHDTIKEIVEKWKAEGSWPNL
ncbi:hypothetical protein SERLADRAFT_351071, partial [Serpula lacrymans var. lacrymans S7.9]